MARSPDRSSNPPRPVRDAERSDLANARHDRAVQRLADQVVLRLADRLHPDATGGEDAGTVDALVAALIDGDDTMALAMIKAAQTVLVDRQPLYFNMLAPAALRLGEMWENDELSFLQLSMAAGRIFAILRTLRRDSTPHNTPERPGAIALFATVPGEEHTLGITMAADLFREAGWHVDLRCGLTHEALITDATRTAYTVIGLSATHPASIPALTRLVRAMRTAIPTARIIVSGRLLAIMPGVGQLCGADAATTDFNSLRAVSETYLPD